MFSPLQWNQSEGHDSEGFVYMYLSLFENLGVVDCVLISDKLKAICRYNKLYVRLSWGLEVIVIILAFVQLHPYRFNKMWLKITFYREDCHLTSTNLSEKRHSRIIPVVKILEATVNPNDCCRYCSVVLVDDSWPCRLNMYYKARNKYARWYTKRYKTLMPKTCEHSFVRNWVIK